MFGWRRKNDGFEWHKYIRTTVKLRRERRRERLDNAKRTVADQARAAGAAARDGAIEGADHARRLISLLPGWLGRLLGGAMTSIASALRPATRVLSRPSLAGPLAIAGAMALLSGLFAWYNAGLTRDTRAAIIIGIVLLAATAPFIATVSPRALPALARKNLVPLGAAAVLVAGLVWLSSGGQRNLGLPSLANLTPLTKTRTVEGRGQALSGDTLRVGNDILRLAGVEAPDKTQRCTRPGNKAWRCGESAQASLERMLRAKPVKCAISGSDDAGRGLAVCSVDGADLAQALVREGSVFAAGGLFAGKYGSHENAAKGAKSGLWSGEVERPSAYRARIWEEARKAAPDGCPIKGAVSSEGKVYILPWAPEYRKVQVRSGRGERWFCSERDAVTAGFKPAERS